MTLKFLPIALLAALPGTAHAELLMFAAASLGGALDRVADSWEAQGGDEVTISYAGSSVLARQIIAGAPADIFVSASPDWMQAVADEGLVRERRDDLLSNRMVLIAADPEAEAVEIDPDYDLAGALGTGRLAMALVDAVPAGQYGRAALEHLGLWSSVEPHVAQAENVRAALALVASGAAPLGVVYATDAVEEPRVTVIGLFPEDSHPVIRYPAAVIEGADPEAEAFLDYLSGADAAAIFESAGFEVPQ